MADLDRAIAAAREALKVKSHPLDSRVTKTLRDLLAALDAARGEAVPDGYTSFGEFRWACDCDERMKREWIPLYAAPPAALAVMQDLSERFSAMHAQGDVWITSLAAAKTVQAAMLAQQPAALAVPAGNVTPMRQPRADLARLVESINAAVYANGDGLSVTEAIGALELAKLELLKEQEQ